MSKKQFTNFVNALINNKVTLKSDKHDEKEVKAPVMNDLALIQQIGGVSQVQKAAEGQARSGTGLGYKASQAEVEAATHIQRLKNQIRKSKEENAVRMKDTTDNSGRHSLIDKKSRPEDERSAIME